MHMIGHDHKLIQLHIGPQRRRSQPLLFNHPAETIELGSAIPDLTQQATHPVGADRHKVLSGL
jgi:hypothetical protein